jgi:hypothetical protein
MRVQYCYQGGNHGTGLCCAVCDIALNGSKILERSRQQTHRAQKNAGVLASANSDGTYAGAK